MDCLGFRKYVGAFADGELDVDRNLDVLEHLNMCPKCAAQVQEIHNLKSVLCRQHESVSAPQARAGVVAKTIGKSRKMKRLRSIDRIS